jgi:Ala-tRNA(Pro) deacylase
MPLTPDDLFEFLESHGIAVTTIDHPPLRTVEEAKMLRGEIEGAHTKNLFLKDKKGRLFLVVVPADASVDLKKIPDIIGANGRISFGSPDLMLEVLGLVPGSVSPFGAINDTGHRVTVVLDEALSSAEKLNHHPLVNTKTTTISRDGLLQFLRATGHEPKILPVSGPGG